MQTYVSTFIFWVSLIVSFIVFSNYGELRGLFSKDKQKYRLKACYAWANFMIRLNRMKVEVSGLENIDQDQKYIFASNHQSVMDIIVLAAVIPIPFVFAVKGSLFKVPLFGRYMKKAGFLSLDRKDPRKDLKNIDAFLKKNTVSLLVYPEGTRSVDGKLKPFKSGVAKFAKTTKLPTLPITVQGTIDSMRSGDKRFRPAKVKVFFGEPLPWPNDKKQYLTMLKEKIAENMA